MRARGAATGARLAGLVRLETAGVGTPRQVLAGLSLLWLLLPAPDPTSGHGVLLAAVAAVDRPGGAGAVLLLLVGGVLWLDLIGTGSPRTLAMAAVGYGVHAVAALAAGVPAGVRLQAGVWWVLLRRGAFALAVGTITVWAAGALVLPASEPVVAAAVGVGLLSVGLPRMLGRWASPRLGSWPRSRTSS